MQKFVLFFVLALCFTLHAGNRPLYLLFKTDVGNIQVSLLDRSSFNQYTAEVTLYYQWGEKVHEVKIPTDEYTDLVSVLPSLRNGRGRAFISRSTRGLSQV